MSTILNDYLNLCRTCLSNQHNMKSLFSEEKLSEQLVTLSDVLMTCASIQVYKGDGLPEQICLQCLEEINRSFSFRKLCEKSDTTLKQYVYISIEDDKVSCKSEGSDNNCEALCNFPDSIENNESQTTNDFNTKPPKINKLKIRIYKCKQCNQIYNGLKEYKWHISRVHDKKYTCSYKSATKLSRKVTGIVKKRNLPRTCNICNKTFRFNSNLERHKLTHTGEKPFLCNVCGKGFGQSSYLKIHSFIHTGEKPYKCKMCDRSFGAPGTLMTHIRTHTGERPHSCKICGKEFSQSGYLSTHIRTHTGEKPVECKVCHRRFNQSGRLIVHMRMHSGEKPYSCQDCGRSFALKGTLTKHVRTHTGERPYQCSTCGQAFAQSGTLATHMKIHKSN